jgi:hypothetical protein
VNRIRRYALAVTVVALLGAGAAVCSASSPATAVTAPAAATGPKASAMILRRQTVPALYPLIGRLGDDLYSPSFSRVFDAKDRDVDLNRVMSACRPPALARATTTILDSWCFADGDARTAEWVPQGVSGVSDAVEDEAWGATLAKPILVTWYSRTKGVRVSVIDPVTRRYRHALLVEPFQDSTGKASYRPVKVHAGGLVWYGRYLYVPDTRLGIRVFDLEHVFDLSPAGVARRTRNTSTSTNLSDTSKIGRHGDVFYGLGYRYLVPQISAWTQKAGPAPSTGSCSPSDDGAGMRFSYLFADRNGPESLVAGEYCGAGKGRMAAWPLKQIHEGTIDATTGRTPRLSRDELPAVSAYRLPAVRVQGVAHVGATWYFDTSNGCGPGTLSVRVWTGSGWRGTGSRRIGVGSEDLYVLRSARRIYTVTENAEIHLACSPVPGRVLYSTPL